MVKHFDYVSVMLTFHSAGVKCGETFELCNSWEGVGGKHLQQLITDVVKCLYSGMVEQAVQLGYNVPGGSYV